jgi:nucleotide-binding universal stress UspA family protein/CBS domain-containing protein
MSFPFRTILLPVDFDEGSKAALDLARQFAAAGDVNLHLVHAMAILLSPGEASSVVVAREQDVKEELKKIAVEHLGAAQYQVHTRLGNTVSAIVEVAADLHADLIVMPTHARRGLQRFLLGSVCERVVREAPCPVLIVRPSTVPDASEITVAKVMIKDPPSVGPGDSLADAHGVMQRGNLLAIPVVADGALRGIITGRDIHSHIGQLEQTRVQEAMSAPLSVMSKTPVEEAARLMIERGVSAVPVLEGGKLVGLLSTPEVIQSLLERGVKV